MRYEFEHLIVTDYDIEGVRKLTLPLLPWKQSRADKERAAFTRTLVDKYDFSALWTTDWVSVLEPGWHVLPAQSVLPTLTQLNEGGWALFLFDVEPKAPLPLLQTFPTDHRETMNLVASMFANAAIFSWQDDLEWIVVTT